jgi:hypothetical protein
LLAVDPDISRVLTPVEIERAFDLEEQFRYVDQIFDRVFAAAPFTPDGSGSAEPAETLGSSRSRH